jgi:hypothetical protein
MKLLAFRIHKPWPHVEVWELREVQIGLLELLRTNLVSMLPLPDPGRPPLRALCSLAERVRPVAFRNPGGDEVRLPHALVITTSLADVLDFLLAAYIPQGDGAIDRCLRAGASGERPMEQVREETGRLLWNGHGHRRWANSGPARRFILLLLSDLPILWYEGGPERLLVNMARIERSDGEYAFSTSAFRVLTCPVSVAFGGIELPRAAWVFAINVGARPLRYWDGQRLLDLKSWEEMPRSLRNQLAQQGTVLAAGSEMLQKETVSGADMDALFLLRVPPAAELARAPEIRPRRRALQTAAILLDSRWPVPLRRDCGRVPLIDDPGIVRYVLQRTTSRRIYLPGRQLPEKPAELAPGSVWIAALPRTATPEVNS